MWWNLLSILTHLLVKYVVGWVYGAICQFVSGRDAFVALPIGSVSDFNKQPKAYKSNATRSISG